MIATNQLEGNDGNTILVHHLLLLEASVNINRDKLERNFEIHGDNEERNAEHVHRDHSENTLATGKPYENYEKIEEIIYGLGILNGKELDIDFDFLFNYVDRDCLSRLMFLNDEEDLL